MTGQRLRPHEDRPHRVYVLCDRQGAVLYVGVSSDATRRVKWHLRSQPWRDEIDPSRTVITDEMPWEDALAIEQAQIKALKPRHNVRRTNGSTYVAGGVRSIIATETRLKRAARSGDPEAVAALERWQDEQAREALAGSARAVAAMSALFAPGRAS